VVELNQKLKRKIAEVKRLENQYETILEEACRAEDVLESSNPVEWAQRNNIELKNGSPGFSNTLSSSKLIQHF